MIKPKNSVAFLTLCMTLVTSSGCQSNDGVVMSELSQGALLSVACASCHSRPGMGVPKLSNLSEARIAKYLTYYKSDEKGTSIMHRLSRGLTQVEIDLIAEYYGQKND